MEHYIKIVKTPYADVKIGDIAKTISNFDKNLPCFAMKCNMVSIVYCGSDDIYIFVPGEYEILSEEESFQYRIIE